MDTSLNFSDKELKNRTFDSFKWKLFQSFLIQSLSLINQVFIARLLSPIFFGTFFFTIIFVEIIYSLIFSLFSFAIISKKDLNQTYLSTIFFGSIILSFFTYFLLIFLSMILLVRINPNISPLYYGVLGLVILIRSISIVPLSLLLKTINFRSFFFTKIFTTLVHFLTVYILIFFGLSEWALVLSLLLSEIIYHFTVFIFNKWHPICFFSFKLLFLSMKTGILYTLINLSNNFHYQIKSFLVGQFFSLESLAFYQKGIYLPTLLMTQTDGVISSIALPLLTAVNDKFILLNVYRRLIKSSFTIVFPMLVGLYVVAEDLILVLFGITWLDSVEFLRASVILVSTWPFLLRVNLFHSIGKSKISFFINIVENFLTISVLIYIYQYGIVNMLYSNFLISLLFVFLSSIIQKKLINYTFKDQISDLLPPLLISLCMGILIVQINLSIFPLLKLLIKSFLGIVTYVMLSVLFKNESFKYLIKLVKFKLFKNTKFL